MRYHSWGNGEAEITLGRREAEALRLLRDGHRYKEIAARMGVSVSYLNNILAPVRNALRTSSRYDLALWALKNPHALDGKPADPTLHPVGCDCSDEFCVHLRA